VTRGRGRLIAVLLWTAAVAVVVLLSLRRYDVGNVIGADFKIWLQTARDVRAHRSPWRSSSLGLFLYPPTIPLLLAPFANATAPVHLWHIWTGLEIAAFVVGVVIFVRDQAPRLRTWQLPILFGFCSVTVLHFWPVTVSLYYGQSDAFVFAVLVWAGLASSRARNTARGILIGVGALLKGWPALVGLALWQRGLEGRGRAVKAFVVTVLLAPISIVAVGGVSGVTGFIRNNVDARNQHLTSASVWGAPKLLFTRSAGSPVPLFVSPAARIAVTAIVLVWVVGLLLTAVRTPGDPSLCMWNVVLCVVLLLPISHLWYSLYALPLLWTWATRVLARSPRWSTQEVVVTVVLVLWWIVEYKRRTNQDLGAEPDVSSVRFCVVFAANLIACTFSVLGARSISRCPRSNRARREFSGEAWTRRRV
jgi:hypothetical protein